MRNQSPIIALRFFASVVCACTLLSYASAQTKQPLTVAEAEKVQFWYYHGYPIEAKASVPSERAPLSEVSIEDLRRLAASTNAACRAMSVHELIRRSDSSAFSSIRALWNDSARITVYLEKGEGKGELAVSEMIRLSIAWFRSARREQHIQKQQLGVLDSMFLSDEESDEYRFPNSFYMERMTPDESLHALIKSRATPIVIEGNETQIYSERYWVLLRSYHSTSDSVFFSKLAQTLLADSRMTASKSAKRERAEFLRVLAHSNIQSFDSVICAQAHYLVKHYAACGYAECHDTAQQKFYLRPYNASDSAVSDTYTISCYLMALSMIHTAAARRVFREIHKLPLVNQCAYLLRKRAWRALKGIRSHYFDDIRQAYERDAMFKNIVQHISRLDDPVECGRCQESYDDPTLYPQLSEPLFEGDPSEEDFRR